MFQTVVAVYVILIIAMIVCLTIINKEDIKNRKTIIRLNSMAISTVALYLLFILVPFSQEHLAAFVAGLYHFATDWLAIFLMLFAVAYTQTQPPTKLPRRIIGFLACVDSVSFVVNTFTHHMFDLHIGIAQGLGLKCWDLHFTPLYTVHLIFVYLIVCYSIGVLLYRFFIVPSIYKSKYSVILIQLAAAILLNMVCTIIGTKFDYSVILYGVLAISVCYFTLYASPKKLLESIHSTIVEDSVIGLFAYDNDGKCVGVNHAAKEMFGHEGEIRQVAEQFLAKWESDHHGSLKNVMGAEQMITKNGEKIYLYVNYQKLLDEKGRVIGSSFQFENRTEVVKRYKEEKYRATHDQLTGLLNRNAFEEEARRILDQADEPYCMVCSNIKDFKLINELYGSDVGDALLIAEADMIRASEYEKSISARIYADKFCRLLPKWYFDEQKFTESMSEVVERSLETPLKTHFYFGVYNIEDVTEPVWTMYDKAMMAIDSISGNYGQFVCYYRDELLQRVIEEKQVIGEFDKAIEEKEFNMFLQPQIANDGTLVGAEALVRWIHPNKGIISPGLFIPVLEKAGLIHRLDLYMWEKAAKKLEEWKKEGKDNLSISVNISTKDFYTLDICQVFRSLAEKYHFDIKSLKLEITESALMKNAREIMKTMDELHKLGYDIEIDDFGSGYSSLGMLKDIHADILKIDMIFLQETKNVERSTTILKNVISMSKELGMPVITEGVETKEQADFLKDVGSDMFQGFYFAKPMSVESFEKEYCSEN